MRPKPGTKYKDMGQRGKLAKEDKIIAKIDAERFWGDWVRDLLSAVKARDTKRQRKLKIEAIEMKDSIEFLEAKSKENLKHFFDLLESRASRYVPPPRPEGEVATLTLTISRPEVTDEPQLQIDQDAG